MGVAWYIFEVQCPFVFLKGENYMAEKRKDDKGRLLEKGESQRKDGSYMYRWNDLEGKRRTIYAPTLNELRNKKLDISKKEIFCGISWSDGKMTVRNLIEQFENLQNVKITTRKKYEYFHTLLEKIGIMDVPIKDIRTSTAKMYMVRLSEFGYAYGTVQNVKAYLSPAFQMAVEDDLLLKNPFLFKLHRLIEDDRKERTCISEEEEKRLLEFTKSHGWFRHSYEDIVILLNTGMRVSELYGLTFSDIDMKNRRIYVNKQLHWIDGKYQILSTKSKAGVRTLAMNDVTRKAFLKKFTDKRPQVEYVIDGHSGFIFINHRGRPKTRRNLQITMENIRKKYKELGLGEFSEITPHVLRHTFCSRMVEKGMNVKTLQMVMGHSDISTTLNVYTHKTPEDVAKEMENIVNL